MTINKGDKAHREGDPKQVNGASEKPAAEPWQMWIGSMLNRDCVITDDKGKTHRGKFQGISGPFTCIIKDNGTPLVIQTVAVKSIEGSNIIVGGPANIGEAN
ncbi:hypothetical protein KAR91_51885 [Candidatus Pacearchaeota archaeon]|nr:hypothetical protein [Candidatus Pacearchaeota archaeon]